MKILSLRRSECITELVPTLAKKIIIIIIISFYLETNAAMLRDTNKNVTTKTLNGVSVGSRLALNI